MIEINVEIPQREVIDSTVTINAKPVITGVTASVDNNVGTPNVIVTQTGTNTEFSFDLAFENLKGDTGDQGETGVSVTGVSLISTVGVEKTYRMTFSDGTYFDYVLVDGSSPAWGYITGTLSNQSDLQNALDNKVNKSGDTMTGNLKIERNFPEYQLKDTGFDFSEAPETDRYNTLAKLVDNSNRTVADVSYKTVPDGRHEIYIKARKSSSDLSTEASLRVGFDANGNPYSNAVTPAANSNTTHIATTAWVREYGADKTLSNVASISNSSAVKTALDGKQETLVSGTNIKTINNESLLGSGNINISGGGTVDQTFSPTSTNAQSGVAIAGAGFLTGITSSDVTTALGYTPVNKAGDTMTGTLDVSMSDTASYVMRFKNTNISDGFIPSADNSITLSFDDTNDTSLGNIFFKNTTTAREIGLRVFGFNGISTPIKIGYDTSNNAYCTFPNTTCVDGQWVASVSTLVTAGSGTALPTTTNLSYSISSYLPADSSIYDYEVLVEGIVYTGSTSGNVSLLTIKGIITEKIVDARSIGGSLRIGGVGIVPISHNDRNIIIVKDSSNTGTFALNLKGYRRLGTNQ